MTAVAPQLARFVAVGGSNTALSLAAFAALAAARVPALAAAALAFALGGANGFLLNRRWTFRASGFASVRRYVAVQAAGLGATDGLVWLLAHGGAGRVGAYALSIPPVTLATFAANRARGVREARVGARRYCFLAIARARSAFDIFERPSTPSSRARSYSSSFVWP